MKRTGLLLSFLAFIASGSALAFMAYRVVANHHGAAAAKSGSLATLDAEYQKIPPDGQSDWLDTFTLTERSERTVQWTDLAGQVRIVSFFFTSCPASCLQQNMKLRDLQPVYAGKDVRLLSITCDPDVDSPERLREYATKLEASPEQWLFLTGRLVYIRRVAGELFQVALDKQTHSEKFIVCDKWGNIRSRFTWNKVDEMAELRLLVDKLLTEIEPPHDLEKTSRS
jgi:cytochrome oxidase Cu insertion factor (SCO1/SenC/PrrC family)